MDWTWIKEAAVFFCTLTGAVVWVVVAFVLGVNAIVWLWTRFLEAAGAAINRKRQRDAERAARAKPDPAYEGA